MNSSTSFTALAALIDGTLARNCVTNLLVVVLHRSSVYSHPYRGIEQRRAEKSNHQQHPGRLVAASGPPHSVVNTSPNAPVAPLASPAGFRQITIQKKRGVFESRLLCCRRNRSHSRSCLLLLMPLILRSLVLLHFPIHPRDCALHI